MATGEDIVYAAYGFSSSNQPGKIADEASELLEFLNRATRAFFAIAARVNPAFFGTQSAVSFASSKWVRPATAELVFRIETAALAEVVVVPIEDRAAEPSLAGVYTVGREYFPRGLANDPSGTLTFWHSRQATPIAALANTIDAGWPENFNQLLSLEVAGYLALKDGRAEELGGLAAQRDWWLKLFLAHVEHADVGIRRRFNTLRRHSDPGIISVSDLLVGGSAVKLGG